MNNLRVLNLDDSKWDEMVKSFKDYDVYYLSGYLKSLKINGDGEPLLFFYEDDNCRGINVVLKRDISLDNRFSDIEKNKYFDFTTPYGYSGWIVEGNEYNDLFLEYEKWCKENNIICEFVRFHPLINNQIYSENNYNVVPLGQLISIDCSNEETMWMNMSSRNRNKIKKAIKTGVVVDSGDIDKLDTFISIYEETMTRDNALDYYFFNRDYYDCLFKELKGNCKIFSASLDGKVLSSCIIFMVNNRLSYHLAGSTRVSGNIYETNLLIYEVAKWGCQNGYKSFLLGGGVGSGEDYLYQFKRGFDDKHSYQFYIGKKIYKQDLYDELVNRRNDISNHNFFPEYRG